MRDSNCCPTGTTTTIIHLCTVHPASGGKTNPSENEHYRVLRFPNFNNGNIAVDQMYCTAFLGVQVKKKLFGQSNRTNANVFIFKYRRETKTYFF